MTQFTWTRHNGYECSSQGDKRFSALFATMPDGRTIEQWYQCDVKGFDPGGRNWRLGKGKKGLHDFTLDQQYQLYKSLWQLWALNNVKLLEELEFKAREHGFRLSDCFATTTINQARALSEIMTEWTA